MEVKHNQPVSKSVSFQESGKSAHTTYKPVSQNLIFYQLFRAPFKNGYNYAGGFWGLKITDPGVKIKGVGYRLSLNSISLEEADGGSEVFTICLSQPSASPYKNSFRGTAVYM